MKFFRKIISKDDVNTGRQIELDHGKAVMIFFLAFIHCTIECTSDDGLCSGIPYLFDSVIGGPMAAPMFMFALGFGIVFSRRNSPKDIAMRGLKLGVISYIFNITRYAVPYLTGYLITNDYEQYIDPLIYRVLGNDILQFSAMAMIFMALLLYLKLPSIAVLGVSIVMSLVSMLLNGVDVDSPSGNILLGYFIGTEDAAGKVFSDFPLMNWFIAPAAGYLFGKVLCKVKNKNIFYACISPICSIFTIVYFYIGITNKTGMFGEGQNCYYHILTNDMIAALSGVIGILGIYHLIARFMPGFINNIISDISININAVYCIHWVFVVWITNVILYIERETQELPFAYTMVLSLAISITSIVIAHYWRFFRRRIKHENEKK
ncbi:MAG: hypothetical protein ACI4Q5_05715 [Porcipelethomonas sp.]